MSDRDPDDSDHRDTEDRGARDHRETDPTERDASDRGDRDPGGTDPGDRDPGGTDSGATDRDETARAEPNIGGDDDSAETSRTEPNIGGDDHAEASRTDNETGRPDNETARTETTVSSRGDPGDPDRGEEGDDSDDGAGLSGGVALLVAAVVALAVTAVAYLWVGGWTGNEVFFEDLFRVAPTVAGGGVGTDWVAGNTVPILDAAIAIVHAADVLMGVSILAILFIHWAIFRRLADRMQRPVSAESRGTVAADGGEPNTGDDRIRREGGDSR